MKILSNVTMAGNVSMASNAKDQFTIGSELERDNANADELKVWANANFYNDVALGSSSADIINVKGQLTSSEGLSTSGSIYLRTQESTIYLGPNDWINYVETALNPLKPVESTGSGISLIYDDDVSKTYLRSLQSDQDRINITTYNNNTDILVELAPQRYDYSVLTSATGTIGTNNTENSEVHYINNLGNSGLSWTLPSAQTYITRVITIKNISAQYNITVNASGSQTIDGKSSITLPINSSYTLQAIDDSGYKWYKIGGVKEYKPYGVFCDTTDQTASATTEAYAMKLNTTEESNGISITNNSRITFAYAGTYNIQFSAQVKKNNAANAYIDIWLSETGSNVPRSNTEIHIQGNGAAAVPAWNFVRTFPSGSYAEIMWRTSDVDVRLDYATSASSPDRPEIPSVIVSVTQV